MHDVLMLLAQLKIFLNKYLLYDNYAIRSLYFLPHEFIGKLCDFLHKPP